MTEFTKSIGFVLEEGFVNQLQSRTFHLHIDGTYVPPAFLQVLEKRFGFWQANFSGHPEGFQHFEPNYHMTMKFTEGKKFREACLALEKLARKHRDFVGYFEGEYIREERIVPVRSYGGAHVPFKLSRRRLDGSTFEQFRESELHLTLDKDVSHPKLVEGLLESGLYGAYIPKIDHTAIVLTIQGFREDIGTLTECLWEYLLQNGGAVRGKLKEEFAIWHRLYGVEPVELPEIIDTVEYFK